MLRPAHRALLLVPIPEYIRALRIKVGNDLLLLPTVTVVVFDASDRALLVKDAGSGLWTTLGGIMEPNETPADAALREAYEETGVTVALQRIVGVFGGGNCTTTYANGDRLSWVSTVFEAVIVSGKLAPDNEEITDLGFFSESEISGMECTPHVREFLEVAWRRASGGYFQPPSWKP